MEAEMELYGWIEGGETFKQQRVEAGEKVTVKKKRGIMGINRDRKREMGQWVREEWRGLEARGEAVAIRCYPGESVGDAGSRKEKDKDFQGQVGRGLVTVDSSFQKNANSVHCNVRKIVFAVLNSSAEMQMNFPVNSYRIRSYKLRHKCA
ncbi:hypothetical protein Q5P01_020599 [Channa striata]|uniref:Uncharacterized protein n=1 Tax=Channa striata TaxID=64152 RepID=A0AA88LYN7_CHASR|nr:hypothetical protein Q5P01_020599 [Channa striata]